MFNIGSWNVRGLNNPQKQKSVREWTTKNNLDIIGLLEVKIGRQNLQSVVHGLSLNNWNHLSNGDDPSRILISWNTAKCTITGIHFAPQWLTCQVSTPGSQSIFRITFIYGYNSPTARQALWGYISHHHSAFSPDPWLLMGDFNAIIDSDDRNGGSSMWQGHQNDFGNCIRSADLVPIHYTGLRHTWHNSQGINTIQKKLDWSFGNAAFLLKWNDAHTIFLPRSISDHSPGITLLARPVTKLRPPFKFLNLWADKEEFLPMVASTWQQEVDGHPFLQLIRKLRLVKAHLKKFHQLHSSHITRRVNNAKDNWEKAQIDLDTNPSNAGLRLQERRLAHQYNQLLNDEESFFRQRSRINWLTKGDRNTKFFHRSLLHRRSRNMIHSLIDGSRTTITDNGKMGQAAVDYYNKLLNAQEVNYQSSYHHFPQSTNQTTDQNICKAFTDEEIRESLFSIHDDKAPGPDGFTALFFKKSWHIVKQDFLAAVRFFLC